MNNESRENEVTRHIRLIFYDTFQTKKIVQIIKRHHTNYKSFEKLNFFQKQKKINNANSLIKHNVNLSKTVKGEKRNKEKHYKEHNLMFVFIKEFIHCILHFKYFSTYKCLF